MIKKLGRNDHCWCGSGKKYKACHEAFDDKLRYLEDIGHIVPSHKLIKTPEQIEKIKESARINVACLDAVAAAIHEGMNTAEIDKIVYDVTTDMGGIPAPLNYEDILIVCVHLLMSRCAMDFHLRMLFLSQVIL